MKNPRDTRPAAYEPGFRRANRMVIRKFHRGNVKGGVVDRLIDAALAGEL
jgi:hypothetical protein